MAEFRINFVPQFLFLFLHPVPKFRNWKQQRRRVRVVEGARLESVYMGNCIMSSNLIVSAKKKVLIIQHFFNFRIIITTTEWLKEHPDSYREKVCIWETVS